MSGHLYEDQLVKRLVLACWDNDMLSVRAAVADGASVNKTADVQALPKALSPLRAAVWQRNDGIAVFLLQKGADPNGHFVMNCCAYVSLHITLQLLVDMGGNVNRPSLMFLLPFSDIDAESKMQVLLNEPSLDLTVKHADLASAEQHARMVTKHALADMIAQETARRAALSSADHRAWVALETYASVRRLSAVRLDDHVHAPCVQALFSHVRFVWIREIARKCAVVGMHGS